MPVTREAVESVLRQYTDPHLNQDPVSAGCVRSIEIQGDHVQLLIDELVKRGFKAKKSGG